MNIFISWSGETSMKIASELKNFIPRILQSAKPYYTPSDIEKGSRWETEINQKLQECLVGLICLTSDNTEKPWIMFEAGALSNRLDKSKVCSILFGLKKSEVTGPLSRFQMTDFNETDFFKLAQSINSSLGDMKIENAVLKESFDAFYPPFEKKVLELLDEHQPSLNKPERPERDILEEILDLVRKQNRTNMEIPVLKSRMKSPYAKVRVYNENDFSVGDKVMHEDYGLGVVDKLHFENDDAQISILFTSGSYVVINGYDSKLQRI